MNVDEMLLALHGELDEISACATELEREAQDLDAELSETDDRSRTVAIVRRRMDVSFERSRLQFRIRAAQVALEGWRATAHEHEGREVA